jgi:uncharacterized protein YndB with AHSA1/START domain
MKWLLRGLGATAALVVICVVALLIMGRRSDAGEVNTAIEINRPPVVVWPWITQPEKQKKWVSWLVDIRPLNQAQGVGAREVWIMRDANNGNREMEIIGEVTELNPPKSVAVKLWSEGRFDGTARYDLTDIGNGRTRMESTGKYHYSQAFARLLEPFISPQAKKKMDLDLTTLKAQIEAEPVAANDTTAAKQ